MRPSATKPKRSLTEPTRTCVGCRRRAGQSVLIRLTVDDGRLVLGEGGGGRGAWLCADRVLDCFDRATARRQWARALRSAVDPASVARLRVELSSRPPTSS